MLATCCCSAQQLAAELPRSREPSQHATAWSREPSQRASATLDTWLWQVLDIGVDFSIVVAAATRSLPPPATPSGQSGGISSSPFAASGGMQQWPLIEQVYMQWHEGGEWLGAVASRAITWLYVTCGGMRAVSGCRL